MTGKPYLKEFLRTLYAIELVDKVMVLPLPTILETYNRRLTLATKLGRGEVLSPEGIVDVIHHEQALPESREEYARRIYYAFAIEVGNRNDLDVLKLTLGHYSAKSSPVRESSIELTVI